MKEKLLSILSNKYINLRYTLSCLICFTGFYLLYWNTNFVGGFVKILFILAGLISLSIIFLTVVKYLNNVYHHILSDKFSKGKREFVFSLSTFTGLIIPVFLANYIISSITYIVHSLGSPNSYHYLYQIKCALLELLVSFDLYNKINYFLHLAFIANLGIFFLSILFYKSQSD